MNQRSTRGFGLLENYLAAKRCALANYAIPEKSRRGRILDLGCGNYPYFLINTEFDEKYGIDKGLFNDFEKIKIKNQDFEISGSLSFPDNFFDVVTILAVLEHLDENSIKNLLSEVHRVLVEKGRLIVTVPNFRGDKILRLMAKVKFVSEVEINEHKQSFDKNLLKYFFNKAGFSQNKVTLKNYSLGLSYLAITEK